jgi:hypothetical protein
VALACTAAGLATFGCANSGAKGVGTPLVLNLYDTSHGVDWTDTVTGDYPDSIGGGYWKGTFDQNKGALKFEDFVLTHSGNTWISGNDTTRYWNGFTTGSNGDKGNYGYADTTHHVGSVMWIDNQWGVMAGGGLATPPTVAKGTPYLVSYWDYYTEESGTHVLKVNLADNSLFKPQEIYICNHPWPYYGNIYGDGFARPFTDGDHFDLWIHAVKANGREDSIPYPLAKYEEGELNQSEDWQQVSLTGFFEDDPDSIQSLYFTMYSTDSDPQYGPNTAVYFCMDKLKVIKQDSTATPAATPCAKTTEAATKPAVEVTDYFPFTSYTGGDVTVHDAKGKVVLKTTVKAGEKPNLSKLPAGEYRLRHGHRAIPVKKVNK